MASVFVRICVWEWMGILFSIWKARVWDLVHLKKQVSVIISGQRRYQVSLK
jgi:hypothetical protein